MVQYGVADFLRDYDKPRTTNIIVGVLFLVAGIVAIMFPHITTGLIVYGFGVIVLLGGITAVIAAYRGMGVSTAGLYIGLFMTALGLFTLFFPVLVREFLTFVLLLFLIGIGSLSFYWVYLIGLKEAGLLPLASGIVSLSFAVMIIAGWIGDANPWLLGLFLGVEILMNGLVMLVLAYVRR